MYGYKEYSNLHCFIYAPDDSKVSDSIKECIKTNKNFPHYIESFKIFSSIEEINAALDKFKSDLLNKYDHHWCIVGTENDIPCQRWLGHYFTIKEYTISAFEWINNELCSLAVDGCWWDQANSKDDELLKGYTKVIFLDIDGVLNRDTGTDYFVDDFVQNLKTIVNETNAKIILSSSWRYAYIKWAKLGFPKNEDEGAQLLFNKLKEYDLEIAGATPTIFNGPEGRPFEIRSWLYRRADLKNFVILDDEEFWEWNWLSDYVVTTCVWATVALHQGDQIHRERIRNCGLNKEKMEEAIQILNR